MIHFQLQHATGKIADGAANCLYAAGLFSNLDLIAPLSLHYRVSLYTRCLDKTALYFISAIQYGITQRQIKM